jgi:hypothetical protein
MLFYAKKCKNTKILQDVKQYLDAASEFLRDAIYSDTPYKYNNSCFMFYYSLYKGNFLKKIQFAYEKKVCLSPLFPPIKDRIYTIVGNTYLHLFAYNKAKSVYGLVKQEGMRNKNLLILSVYMDDYEKMLFYAKKCKNTKILQDVKQYLDIPRKSPTIATMLSIIPGAGHIYTDEMNDAIINFITISGLVFLTYEAYKNKNWGAFYPLFFFSTVLYTGNIYGAYRSAVKYNATIKYRFIKDIEKKYLFNEFEVNRHKE